MNISEELDSIINSFKIKSKTLVDRKNKFVKADSYLVELEDGKKLLRDKLIKNNGDGNAIAVIPIFPNGDFFLCVEPRVFTKTGVGIGFPAGYVEDGEEYIDACRRELLEETGIVSSNIIDLGGHYQDTGISGAFIKVYVAFDCSICDSQHLDNDEFIKNYRCQFDEVISLMDQGYISDANFVIAVYKLIKYLEDNNICLKKN